MNHVRRYRIGIAGQLPDPVDGPVELAIDRLISAGRLVRRRHATKLTYFTAGGERALSDSAFIRAMAVSYFCMSQVTGRTLLLSNEIRHYFPTLFRSGLPAGHYLDRSREKPRLGLVRIDVPAARIGRLASRAARLIDRYREQAGFRELMVRQQFEITFVVPTSPKARRLQLAFKPLEASGVPIHVVCIPGLLPLMAPLPPVGRLRRTG